MGDKINATSDLLENQGESGTDDAAGNYELPADKGAGSGTPAGDSVPHEAESSEANPGSHQEQAGMRS